MCTQTQSDWQSVHDQLSRMARERARFDCEEGRLLLRAVRAHVHLHLGFASFAEYIERTFGYAPRWTQERLRVAEQLEVLPLLQRALHDGAVPWSTARELTRVATPTSEQAWLDVARGKTLRQVEQLVAGHAPGDLPGDAPSSSLRRHVLRFDVSADTLATFRDAMAKLRRDSEGPLDEDSALLLMARRVLVGPSDAGRSNYQLAMTVCRDCQRGWQQGKGELVEVDAAVVEMASCDAQHVGAIAIHDAHVGDHRVAVHRAPVGDDVTIATHGAHVGRHNGVDHPAPKHAPGRAASGRDVEPRGQRHRAHQDIPPAVRRQVLRRDGGRCLVPGCRHATFVDIHHLIPRAEGGDHDPDTLVTLCAAHHRAQHRGQLVIEGCVASGLVFRHADGSCYGTVVNPIAADTYAQVFRALAGLGFREREARGALELVRTRAALEKVRTRGASEQVRARATLEQVRARGASELVRTRGASEKVGATEQVRARAHVGAPTFETVLRDALAVLTAQTPASRTKLEGGRTGRASAPSPH